MRQCITPFFDNSANKQTWLQTWSKEVRNITTKLKISLKSYKVKTLRCRLLLWCGK